MRYSCQKSHSILLILIGILLFFVQHIISTEHGHCNVPSTYPKNQPLAYWVFKQRGQYRLYQKPEYDLNGQKKQTCHMTTDRIAKLDAIGFEWNPPRRIAR